MIRSVLFPVTLLLLAVAIFVSPTFKIVSAGIAILLFGMMMLESGFNSFVNGPLQKLLRKTTNTLYKSLSLGFVATALLQSSSLISVITISFLSAGLLDLYAGIGIIFGANIGTTATAWLVSIFGLKIKISVLAMPMLVFGIIFNLQPARNLKGAGNILAGLGFFFLGIHFMKEGFDQYGNGLNLADYALPGGAGLAVYCLIGIAITMILQSSSATMALILTALAVQQITYQNSLALAIGANIGTTITATISAIGANSAGKKLAGAHFIFNVATGFMALLLIVQLSTLVDMISSWLNIAPNNYVLKLSIFHSVFNITGVVVMVPMLKPLIRLLNRVFIEKEKTEEGIEYPAFLNDSALAYPQSAFAAIINETKRLFEETTFMIVAHGLNLHREDIKGDEKLKKIVKRSREQMDIDIDQLYYHKVKIIYSKIIKYATLAQSKFDLSPGAQEKLTHLKLANRNIVEVIKDTQGLHKNVSHYMLSDNPFIRKEYDKLRKKVSATLREIYLTRIDPNPSNHLESLEILKDKTLSSDPLIDGTLDCLINEQKISSIMATSLANDSENISRIIRILIETAELLYINTDIHITIDQEAEEGVVSGV